MTYLEWYLSVGITMYLFFLVKDAFRGFPILQKANVFEFAASLLVIIMWPIILFQMEIVEL